jgi:hypothetical protein
MNVEMIAPEFIMVDDVQKRIDELERELAASSDASRRHQIGSELQASAFRLYKLNRRRRGLRASTTPWHLKILSVWSGMVDASPPILRKCRIENHKIVFCPPHQAVEDLLAGLEYARRFIADHALPAPGDEGLKTQIVLPYLDGVLARARKLE